MFLHRNSALKLDTVLPDIYAPQLPMWDYSWSDEFLMLLNCQAKVVLYLTYLLQEDLTMFFKEVKFPAHFRYLKWPKNFTAL